MATCRNCGAPRDPDDSGKCPECGYDGKDKVVVANETVGISESAKIKFLRAFTELEKQLQENKERIQPLKDYWKIRNLIVHQQTTEKLSKEIEQKTKELKEYADSLKEKKDYADEGVKAYLNAVYQALGKIDDETKQEEKSKEDDIIERLQRIENNQNNNNTSAKKHHKISYIVGGIGICLAIFGIILATS